jgi:hypothetical protein
VIDKQALRRTASVIGIPLYRAESDDAPLDGTSIWVADRAQAERTARLHGGGVMTLPANTAVGARFSGTLDAYVVDRDLTRQLQAWKEDQHPRKNDGKFAPKGEGGGGSSKSDGEKAEKKNDSGSGESKADAGDEKGSDSDSDSEQQSDEYPMADAAAEQVKAGKGKSKDDPIELTNAEDALGALANGYHVALPEREVGTLVDKLGQLADEAKRAGKDAPNIDLCLVSAPGTNLFCAEALGVPRAEMPQFKGKPAPGSPAAEKGKSLGLGEDDEVSMEDEFIAELEAMGISSAPDEVADVSYLKATQNQLIGPKIGGMMRAMESGKMPASVAEAPILVSRDNYVLDGHHRWAARVGLRHHQGKKIGMKVIRVDLPMTELLPLSQQLAEKLGVAVKAASTTKESRRDRRRRGGYIAMAYNAPGVQRQPCGCKH